jgi:hypothetical protein
MRLSSEERTVMRGFIVVALACIGIGLVLSQCEGKQIDDCKTGPDYQHECTTK